MRDPLHGILDRMREVVHRIDAPFVPGIVMAFMRHPVENRIPHIDIGARHIDPCAERALPVPEASVPHRLKEAEALLRRAVPEGALAAGMVEIPAVPPDLLRAELIDKGLPLSDQKERLLIHNVKIVGGKEEAVSEIRPQPLDIPADGIHKLRLFLRRIGVVKAEIEAPPVFFRDPVIQKDGLRVSDMEVAVWLRGEAGLHLMVSSLLQIPVDLLLDKIPGFRRALRGPFLFCIRHFRSSRFMISSAAAGRPGHVEILSIIKRNAG